MSLKVSLDPAIYEGQWKEFKPGVRALILPYTRKVIRRILVAASIPDEAMGNRVDPELWDLHLHREIIKDIEGFVDADDNPLKRSDEVIDIICDQVEGFAVWAQAESALAAKTVSQRLETETKNLKRSPAGKQKGRKA